MSQDTTTISIRDDQKDELEAMKTHERESYKAVIDRLLDTDAQGDTDTKPLRVVPVEEVVGREVPESGVDWDTVNDSLKESIQNISTTVQLEATEYSKIADELEGRLKR